MIFTGALAALGLWGVERAATSLIVGTAAASAIGGALCRAHVIGFTAITLATDLGWPIWLLGVIIHLALTWRAWIAVPARRMA